MTIYREPRTATHPFEYVLIGIIIGAGVAFAITYYGAPSKTVTSYFTVSYTTTQTFVSTVTQGTTSINAIKNPSFVVTGINLTVGRDSAAFLIIIQNSGNQPIVSLSAYINVSRQYNVSFTKTINGSTPLNPGESVIGNVQIPSASVTPSKAYPVLITAFFADGSEQIQRYSVLAS